MARPPDQRHTLTKSAIALLLTFAAGIVDIIGYVTVYHTFTAHMTGTTVHLGNALVERHWPEAIIAASVVLAFLTGSVLGRSILEVGARKRVRSIAVATLGIEFLLLLTFLVAAKDVLNRGASATSTTASLLAVLAAAMGLQTATLTRVGPLTVHTTFVTGMLNKLAQMISHALHATWDILTSDPDERAQHHERRRTAGRQAQFLLSIWVAYLGGAAGGTWLQMRWGVRALIAPAAALLIAMAVDCIRPLSVEEEKEQMER
jgi:uncharacterized membrane protein YoaK (UPF0700 family)